MATTVTTDHQEGGGAMMDDQHSWIPALAVSSASLSFLGSIYMILMYLFATLNYDTKTWRLAFYISIADGLSSVCWILNYAGMKLFKELSSSIRRIDL